MLHFNPKELRPVIEEAFANQCELLLVKDQGIYLMPARGDRRADGRTKHLVYADGCHPEKDESWYETSRALAGGDDFGEHLVLTESSIMRILLEGQELWIHLLPETISIYVTPVFWVPVADYRRITMRMLNMVEANYSACVSNAEFKQWRKSAITLLGIACHTDSKRAKSGDRNEHQTLIERLKQRIDCVNADGAIRYPTF
ncbi:TPA: DUF3085 domain-containing protein [Serratia odorifera]|nr:DUF3085 domain-containing protein [Serratia odorifera]